MVKMVALSRPHRNSNSNNFNNFSCHRSEECPHQFSWHSDQICRRSLLKCVACPILVIYCHQEGALWVWLNFSIWMASGRDSYHTCKVSYKLDNVQWSYKHLIFLGEMLKMADLSRPHRKSDSNNFNNFWSPRGLEHTQRFSWESDKIPRRSSLNSNAWNRQKCAYFETSTGNSGLPVDLIKKSKCANLIVLACSTYLPNFIWIGQTTDFSWIFKDF